jgi:hypothetical protein
LVIFIKFVGINTLLIKKFDDNKNLIDIFSYFIYYLSLHFCDQLEFVTRLHNLEMLAALKINSC